MRRWRYILAPKAFSWSAMVAIIALFFVWGLRHLGGFSWSWDEGVLLGTGRLTAHGYPLYTRIWYNYPPIFPLLLKWVFRIEGETISAARGMALCFSALALVAAAWVAYEVHGKSAAALLATILLLIAPPFLANSRAVLADLPAAGLAALAVALALRATARRSRLLWLGAGLAWGFSLGIKPTSVFAAAPLLLLAIINSDGAAPEFDNLRAIAGRCLLGIGGVAIALAVGLLTVDVGAFVQQMMGTFASSQAETTLDLAKNVSKIAGYLAFANDNPIQYGYIALAAVGIGALWREPRNLKHWALIAWFALGLIVWISYSPLYTHHLVTLLIPFVILAAIGLETTIATLATRLRSRWLAVLGVVSLVLLLIGLPAQVARDLSLAWPPDDDEDEDALKAAALVQTWVQPDEWIVTDSLTLAFHADRDVPPELVNTSSMRIKTGQLTTAQAITWTKQYQPAAIIFWDDRLEDLPGYAEWVEQRYRLVKKYGKERRVYAPNDLR